ncbi:MAG: mannosyl-3-phosphoglycerate synthase [Nitrososphaerales archaeon]
MRIELPRYTEMFGAAQINEVQRVYELDSGVTSEATDEGADTVCDIGREVMNDIEQRMAIVISTKDEKLRLLEGVMSGIPHDCLIILVSNSARKPIDRYKNEVEMVKQFNQFAKREVIQIHQKDPGLAKAFREVGYTDILRGKRVRDGKGEGVLLGLILAKLAKKDYVGFMDADNYLPGAVHEYVKNFDSGFSMASSPYSMVRISWLYKPTVTETGFYFSKWGRVNEYTNKYLNRLISINTGFGTEIIKTGNSGEYATSMKLAEMLTFSSGFSVEPHIMVNILEEFGSLRPIETKDIKEKLKDFILRTPQHLQLSPIETKNLSEKGVQIYQIETRNPYVRVEKSDEHLGNMLLSSIGVIYHSGICNDNLRQIMMDELIPLGLIKKGVKPPKPPTMRPIKGINFKKLQRLIESEAKTLVTMGETSLQKPPTA